MRKKSPKKSPKNSAVSQFKKEFSQVFRIMNKMGWDEFGFGHCSFRLADGSFLINQENVFFGSIRAKNVVHIDADGASLDGNSPASFKTHRFFHRADPENNVVLHSHFAPAVVMANIGKLRYVSQYEGMLGKAVFLKSPKSGLHEEHFSTIGDNPSGTKVVFCEQHGVFVFGANIVEAFFRLYLVCRAAEVVVLSGKIESEQTYPGLELKWPKEQAINEFWANLCEKVK